ncbi:MAG: CpsB/CapC family capsule biosynthesis tyrosine phosphatase [Leeuwenhoekiella sp.]
MLFSFKPKTRFIDLLDGFVDIHNHILPSIDDGADTVEDSINLIDNLTEIGISHFIPTPHTIADVHPNSPQTITVARKKLEAALKNKGIASPIKNVSSEYMMDSSLIQLIQDNNILPLKDNYVLVEMSYLQPPINLEEILFEITNSGWIPVLAHPERYNFYGGVLPPYQNLKKLGCLFQLNMLSLGNYYGKAVNRTATELLKSDFYDFIGSDVHHMRHIENLKDLKLKGDTGIYQKLIENTKYRFS